ncbi:hypothetical protein OC842_002390 [Tilletia horrida]|uniref:Protein kinase domain-containing protein n=1 Tax=Tilletia horrida TaxID=155126 RepID=A0AAN6GDD2_9BASI|nr:hypothetical protein OC842_002390 [Tilletia horrida]
MDTPGRHPRRLAHEQQGASHTPTLTTRTTLAHTPAASVAQRAVQNSDQNRHPQQAQQLQHSAQKTQPKHALLPDFHFQPTKDAQGKSIRPAPGLAVAPPAMGNPDQSVSMDISISAEVGAQKPTGRKTPNSSAESYSTPITAGHQRDFTDAASRPPEHGRQLLSPAQVSERSGADLQAQGKTDQYQILRTDVQQTTTQPERQPRAQQQEHKHPADREPASPSRALAPPATSSVASSSTAQQNSGVYSLSDEQLADRLHFEKEIGHGNWGSIWTVQPRHPTSLTPHLPATTLAAKLCHRQRTAPSNARVRSLWNEFKVLKAVGSAPWPKNRNPRKASLSVGPGGRGRVMVQPPAGHPAIMRFYEFLITPSYAVILMPYFRQPMNVALPPETCRAYFQHLLSGVFWLHQNNVTHNDVKTANTMIEILQGPPGTPHDAPLNPVLHSIPILADFGFAQLHDEASVPKNFDKDGNLMPRYCTKNSWGTPEYLSPERARGDLHDERPSDLWSLGVTFFEIATGRTPFENEEEQFLTKEELAIYYERTISGSWIGTYSISADLEDLIRGMLNPDPLKRIGEADALLHPYFVDSELIQDAEEADDLCDLTDDLDASLGAVVRAQVEAVKAERTRREAYECEVESLAQQRQDKDARVLDEPSVDIAIPRHHASESERSHPSSHYQQEAGPYEYGQDSQANGLVSNDTANRRTTLNIMPVVRDPNVEEVGHHSRTTASAESRRDAVEDHGLDRVAETSVQEDKHTRKYWKPALNVINTDVAARVEDQSIRTPHSPAKEPVSEAKNDNMFSPMVSKYKKSQALLSGAFHGTPMSKAKQREAVGKEAAATPSKAHATAVISTPRVDRNAPLKSPMRSRMYQHELDTANALKQQNQGRDREAHPAKSQHVLASPPRREVPALGSPILLERSLDAAPAPDSRMHRAPQRDAWALSASGEEVQEVASSIDSQQKPKDGGRFMAFARTVKRSMSKSSIFTDSNASRSPKPGKAPLHKAASPPVLQCELSSDQQSNRATIQQRRQQAAERLERAIIHTPKVPQDVIKAAPVDSPSSWYSAGPAAGSETSLRAKVESPATAGPADGRENPQLSNRRKTLQAAEEVLSKWNAQRSLSVAEDSDHDEEEEDEDEDNLSDGRKSPTLVASQHAAARAKAAKSAQQNDTESRIARTQARNDTAVVRGVDRRRTSSEHQPSPAARTTIDAIAGRLDAMSQHASSLLRLVEETRSTIDSVKTSSKEETPASAAAAAIVSQNATGRRLNITDEHQPDSEDEVDQALKQRSPIARVPTAAEEQRPKHKQPRPFSMHELQAHVTKEHLVRADASLASEGNVTTYSNVGEQSEGTTLVGDFSSAGAYAHSGSGREAASWTVMPSSKAVRKEGHQSRLSVIATPLKAKVKSALYDNVNTAHKTPMAQGSGYGAGENQIPAYATVRKHNSGWQVDGQPMPGGEDSFRAAHAPGSPESSHWVKVEDHHYDLQNAALSDTKSQPSAVGVAAAAVSQPGRFSMRRTRSFVLSALTTQMQQQQQQQQQQVDTSVGAPENHAFQRRSPNAGARDGSNSPSGYPDVTSPATALANANRSARATASVASNASALPTGTRSSVSSRGNHLASPVSQVPPAVVSPRGTPGKAVTRFLKLIRGGGAGGAQAGVAAGAEVGAVAVPRAYQESTGASTASVGDDYRS